MFENQNFTSPVTSVSAPLGLGIAALETAGVSF